MRRRKPPQLTVDTFADHQVITQPNPLRKLVRPLDDKDSDDPVARAEQALADLAGEFGNWMQVECERLGAAHDAILRDGLTPQAREELFRAAHDIKGGAATFGYPTAAAAAESLCRIIEHAPDLAKVPGDLILHHVNAIQAIVREQPRRNAATTATELSGRLRDVADEFLIKANHDRPEHLEAVLAPSIVPGD
jgi:HPt (histidine-containing phosphotransfer) domain-containing protein